MNRTFKSATLKLTAYYMAIIMVICLMFSTAIYHFANNELRHGLDRQSQRIVDQYPGFDFEPALRPTRDFSEGSHRILLNLVYINLFLLVVSGVAGYALAKRTLEPIQQSHEQQKRFTSDVSHELRTPLTALKMSSEVALLDDKATKPELRDALTSNLEEANKLELLINNLLRLTRLEATELRQSFVSLDGRKLIEETIAEHAPSASSKDIRIRSEIPKALPVHGDATSLKQLLGILLDNAIKYSPKDSTIEISGDNKDNLTHISITDHGMGIMPDALPHIFDRFYRADAARGSGEEGSGYGLGLSIAKQIADMHSGAVHISSTSGHGTTASIELPATQT